MVKSSTAPKIPRSFGGQSQSSFSVVFFSLDTSCIRSTDFKTELIYALCSSNCIFSLSITKANTCEARFSETGIFKVG